MNRILVVTGGGADGAVTVSRLIALGMPSYKYGVGISTGSLIVPHALLSDGKKLKEFYLNVKQKDITDDSPFKRNGKLNVTKAIKRVLASLVGGRLSIGSSKALRETIGEAFTSKEYKALSERNKVAYVGAYSLNTDSNTYFNSSSSKYLDFLDWMWASANPPIVFSLLEKVGLNGIVEQWCDGGVQEVMPISFALCLANQGDEVDVFMHRPKRVKEFKPNLKNIIQYSGRVLKAIFRHSEDKDLSLGLAIAKNKKVKLNVYWMGKEVNDNSLVFDKKEMLKRFELGKSWIQSKFVDSYDFREN